MTQAHGEAELQVVSMADQEQPEEALAALGSWARDRTLPLTEAAWRGIGRQLAGAREKLRHGGSRQMWEIGDWVVAGEDDVFKHLSRSAVREMAARISGYSRHTLRNAVYVARKVDPSMRIDGLTWWHHLVVSRLDPEERNSWLTRAAEEEWSVQVLRQRLRERTATPQAVSRRSGRLVSELIKLRRGELPEPAVTQLREWWRREMQAAIGG